METIQPRALTSEDGNPLHLQRCTPAKETTIHAAADRMGVALPPQLHQLLQYSDGLNLFGETLYSTNQLRHEPAPGLIIFHDWGNGDFDGIAANSPHYPDGAIVFINHSPNVHTCVCDNLTDWITQVISEIAEHGTLFHPTDYRDSNRTGLYKPVYETLCTRDCELNS